MRAFVLFLVLVGAPAASAVTSFPHVDNLQAGRFICVTSIGFSDPDAAAFCRDLLSGHYYLDRLGGDAQALLVSWIHEQDALGGWNTTDATLLQPGTARLEPGPVCLPGDPFVPPLGCPGPEFFYVFGFVHPYTEQAFAGPTEQEAWNVLVELVGMDLPEGGDPLALGVCSFASPLECESVATFAVPEPTAALLFLLGIGFVARGSIARPRAGTQETR